MAFKIIKLTYLLTYLYAALFHSTERNAVGSIMVMRQETRSLGVGPADP